MTTRSPYDIDDVFLHALFHPHIPDLMPAMRDGRGVLKRANIEPFQMVRIKARVPAGDDLAFVGFLRIIDDDLEQEAVELRFGQRIRAVLVLWILCGDHKEFR